MKEENIIFTKKIWMGKMVHIYIWCICMVYTYIYGDIWCIYVVHMCVNLVHIYGAYHIFGKMVHK